MFKAKTKRTERQPEFTQIDVEMSFSEEEEVLAVARLVLEDVERMICGNVSPIQTMTYSTAMR